MDIDETLIEFNQVMKNIDNYFSDPQSDLEIFRFPVAALTGQIACC